MVERLVANEKIAGSIPVTRSIKKLASYSFGPVVELVYTRDLKSRAARIVGSSPTWPITLTGGLEGRGRLPVAGDRKPRLFEHTQIL